MKLTPLGSNQTMLELSNGTDVLFSYKTPVAAYLPKIDRYIRTETKWSSTTTRHINKWLVGIQADKIFEVNQSELDNLVDS